MKKTALVFLWILLASGISACGKQASAEGSGSTVTIGVVGGSPGNVGSGKGRACQGGDKP